MVPEPSPIRNHWAAVVDHTRRYQDFTYVYPVISRRSGGLSIGINLNPDKRCNFDCVYCEVDRKTPPQTRQLNLDQVRDELRWLVRHALSGGLAKEPKFEEVPELTRIVRDIAFSGDGEPTMVPNFDACVEVAVEVRREFELTDTKIVLITDAAGLDKARVRSGLALMDANNGEVWGKLDAGTEGYFRRVNRTHIFFRRILDNLRDTAKVRPIVIQSLFLKIAGEIMPAAELAEYIARLNEILQAGGHIREVHAYTIARPTPEPWATRLNAGELAVLGEEISRQTGLQVRTFD